LPANIARGPCSRRHRKSSPTAPRALGTIRAEPAASLWQSGGYDPRKTAMYYIPSKIGPGIITVRNESEIGPGGSHAGPGGAHPQTCRALPDPQATIQAASPRSISTRANSPGWCRSARRPRGVTQHEALQGRTIPNTGGINLAGHAARDQDLADRGRRLGGRACGAAPIDKEDRLRSWARVAIPRHDGQHADGPIWSTANSYIAFTVRPPRPHPPRGSWR